MKAGMQQAHLVLFEEAGLRAEDGDEFAREVRVLGERLDLAEDVQEKLELFVCHAAFMVQNALQAGDDVLQQCLVCDHDLLKGVDLQDSNTRIASSSLQQPRCLHHL